jgi:hypothetical protein
VDDSRNPEQEAEHEVDERVLRDMVLRKTASGGINNDRMMRMILFIPGQINAEKDPGDPEANANEDQSEQG